MVRCPRCGAEGKFEPRLQKTFNAALSYVAFARINCGSESCGLWIRDYNRDEVEMRDGQLRLKAA